MILLSMNTAISTIVVIAAALDTAGITIGSSEAVHAEATDFQGGTCTKPDKAKLVGE